MKKTSNSAITTVDQIVTDGVAKGILHLYNEDEYLKGNSILIKGKEVINFGSCSYLGLEFDRRMKDASKKAIDDFGTQFSESRAYVSLGLYNKLEKNLSKIFGKPVIVTPTTTLGHIAAIPVLVDDSDAVILDHQVHSSVQTAVSLLKARGIHTELLRHNRMDLLEERIKELSSHYKKIWYMADGIYSMFGDACPLESVVELLDKHPQLHFYVDDAHGMSYFGKNGAGFTLSKISFHDKMILGTSLNKAFASGGGVIIFPNEELKRKVRTCGGPLITSGPMQPSGLGAALKASEIHLSPEIYTMQEELQEKIKFTNLMIKKYGLPLISESEAAIFFIGVSLPKLGYNMIKRMLNEGYYLNLGIFPAVPMRNTGIRFTITRLHSLKQIESMIATMAMQFPLAMAEEGITMPQIYKAFKMQRPEEIKLDRSVASVINQSLSLTTLHHKSITEIDKAEWNCLLGNNGSFDWDGCQFLENAFSDNNMPQDNWEFDYIIIRDKNNKPVLATFTTTGIWKDDMLSPAEVSAIVEQRRINDPYYLTSKVLSTGSLLTEGEHIYIDRTSELWKDAMHLFFEKITLLQDKYDTQAVVIRDFINKDPQLDSFLIDNGYFKVDMPDSSIVSDLSWNTSEEFYNSLSKRSRQHFREDIKKHTDKYIVKVESTPTIEMVEYWYSLYLNVKNKNLGLNTFPLPFKLFKQMVSSKNWEVITLQLEKEFDSHNVGKPIAVVFCYKTEENYVPMIIGLNYIYNRDFKTYRQTLYQLVLRGNYIKKKRVSLGFSASTEKKKVGAQIFPVHSYMQVKDNFNLQLLAEIKSNSYLTPSKV